MLEIEPGELMAGYWPLLTSEGRDGLKAEILLYDTLPGGAGFSSQLVDRGIDRLGAVAGHIGVNRARCTGRRAKTGGEPTRPGKSRTTSSRTPLGG